MTLKEPQAIRSTCTERYIQSFYALLEQPSFSRSMWEQIPSPQQKVLQQALPAWLQQKAAEDGEDLPSLIKNARLCVYISKEEEDHLYRIAHQSDEKRGIKPRKVVLG